MTTVEIITRGPSAVRTGADLQYQVAVDRATPHTVLELRRTVRADRAGDDIGDGMRALYEFAAAIGRTPAGPPSTTYLGTFGAGVSSEVYFTLPVTADAASDFERISVHRTEDGLFAHTTHRGDYQRIGDAYRALDEWIRGSEYRRTGPPTEVYLLAPDETVAARDLLTEI